MVEVKETRDVRMKGFAAFGRVHIAVKNNITSKSVKISIYAYVCAVLNEVDS